MTNTTVLAAMALLVSVSGYVGSYVWVIETSEIELRMCGHDTEPMAVLPAYQDRGLVGRFFMPVHILDRQVRPKYWALHPLGLEAKGLLGE